MLDLTDPARPVEVSRLQISDDDYSHWTAWDAATQRMVVTPKALGTATSIRMYVLTLDPGSGALSADQDFRDTDGEVGFSFGKRKWPRGWTGAGLPHGAVFSR